MPEQIILAWEPYFKRVPRPMPVVAIGGIGKQNIEALAGSGIAGVALVSVVFAAEDIEQECRGLLKQIERIV